MVIYLWAKKSSQLLQYIKIFYKESYMRNDRKKKCVRCGNVITPNEDETWFAEGSYYSVKLCRCPECKAINVLKYYIDPQDKHGGINFDLRYYTYI